MGTDTASTVPEEFLGDLSLHEFRALVAPSAVDSIRGDMSELSDVEDLRINSIPNVTINGQKLIPLNGSCFWHWVHITVQRSYLGHI